MALMSELPGSERRMLETLPCPEFDDTPWVEPRPLAVRSVAIVSTAGLMPRGARPITPGDPRYQVIEDDRPASEIVMSHVSVNFDRTGFQRDLNTVLPRERLHELVRDGTIGAVASRHYAFMGATPPEKMTRHAHRLAGELQRLGVDSAILIPV